MKPNFALNLTQEAIILLHRTARGWLAIGEAALDSADLSEALGYLRASALGLSPQGVTTKLILPNSQVLYTEVEAPGPDAAARRRQVAAGLEGLTPYAVEDLVFDIWGKGPRVQVAVVARETLDEAEGFVDQHRFNPVSFVAIPPAGAFGGEPFFGQTKAAARLLAAGESVARDQDPVAIVSRDGGRDDAAPRQPRDAARPAGAEPPAAAQASDATAGVAAETRGATAAAAAAPAKADPAPLPPVAAAVVTPVAAIEPPTPAARVVAQDLPAPPKAAPPVDAPAPLQRAAPPPVLPPPPRGTASVVPPPEAPVAAVMPPATTLPTAPDALPPTPAAAAPPPALAEAPLVPAFSSRRRDEPARAAAPPVLPGRSTATLPVSAPDPVAAPAAGLSAQFSAPPRIAAATPAPPVVAPPIAAPQFAAPPIAAPLSVPPLLPTATPLATSGGKPAVRPLAAEPPPRTAMPPVQPAKRSGQTLPPTDLPPKPSTAGAAARLRPGAAKPAVPLLPASRVARPQPGPGGDGSLRPGAAAVAKGAVRSRGKPRYLGLALTGALLIFLMLVAAYSSLYLSRDAPATVPDTAVAAATGDRSEPAAPAPVIVSAGDPVEPDPALLADMAEPAVAAPPDPAAAAPPAAPPPAAVAGDTTVGLSTASAATGQDEIFLSAVDAPPPAFDALALPAPVAGPDAAPGTTAPPPPFGTVYQFDAQGRILAGETGVVAPGGFWLISARPPLIPPPRPVTAQAEAPDPALIPPDPVADPGLSEATGTAEVDGGLPTGAFAPDATVTARRPQTRPAGLTPPPAAAPAAAAPLQADDGASLTRDDPRYAGMRPRARSAAVLARAAQAADGAQALASASLVTAPDVTAPEVATPVVLLRPAEANPLAVSLSRRPAARPRDVSRAVAAAAEVAQPRAEPAPAPAPEEQAASPEAEPEPEVVASAAPRIPTHANVAKQATFANAINLSKVNLIGIYGTPSSRYAMVRTSGGRFTKVKVGDRVDGGTIAAITASEVRYKKGGRMLTLAMPRG